jgi:choline dehydrogenase-like flavoprotein
MLRNGAQHDSRELSCRVCVIGAGAAGITLALELARHNLDVVLVTGGGVRQSEANCRLYEGTANPPGSHERLEELRVRAFGGGTLRWGGRLVPFDRIDFEKRPFVPHSGWPISYEEVAALWPRAAALCEVGPDPFQVSASRETWDVPDSLGNGAIDTRDVERWSTPTDFAARYRDELLRSANIRVLVDHHAVELRLSDDLQRIERVRLVSRSEGNLDVKATVFVLAAGGIENARLLLASRNQIAAGIGNHSDMVGRCYMSHMAGTYGWLTLNGPGKPPFYRLAKDGNGSYYRRRFRLSDQAQRELGVMNIIAFPFRPDIGDPSHRDAVLSLLYLEHLATRHDPDVKPSWKTIGRHLANVAFNHPLGWFSGLRQLWARSRRPRLPFILPYHARAQDLLFFQSEHAPNRDSRLVLGDAVDEFGMPRVEAQVRFLDIDTETVCTFYRQLDQALRTDGVGRLEYDEAGLRQYLAGLTRQFHTASHHLGTTRMSADPAEGVVDPQCRVHSVDNLYVSGGSVFPTAGHANPTLTLLSLTLRLAEHLRGRLSPHGSAPLADVAGSQAPCPDATSSP